MGLTDDITDPRLAKALAHPLRLEILRHLGDRTASPSEIATEIGAPLTNVSYHVRKLRALGLIKLVRKTPKRGVVEHYYSAKPRTTVSDEAWAGTPAIVKEALLSPMLEAATKQLANAISVGGFDRRDAHFSEQPLKLDVEGWEAVAAILKDALEGIIAAQEAATERLAGKPDAELIVGETLMMLFETAKPADGSSPDQADGAKPARGAARKQRSRAAR